ncbi:FAD-dependent monooxygenase [Streptomyces sp. NBC_00038]|uniref:FAD-dependent monooxygenase n=1 Tax=Streptomyces sp. NBC_00038 TaxID=2903615 RepID=UPI0022559012|nr:FAD-dependent monooxygenase [Streptomyces sp. NBC_00038]MCX5554402.1 FAD-dependent monooxygenase [Streptomyces sp. NBC_00038]
MVRGVQVQAQVVICGGGPVGMLLACELAGRGVSVVVVEVEAGVCQRPKATTLHARTVQCLVRRGHLAGLAAAGEGGGAGSGGVFHFGGLSGLLISVPVGEPVAVLKCAQVVLERHFEGRARGLGVRVLRGCRVVGVREEAEGVHVTAEGPGGRVECTGAYLVGADGARSVVREEAGFASRSYPATVSAMAGDVRFEGNGGFVSGWHRTPRGWVVAKEVGGGVVRLRTLNCSGAVGGVGRGVALTVQELGREVSWIAGREVGVRDGRWLSRFSDFSRLARSYRRGRVFLAGDAAHVHFPIGGQGLSTGLLDAVDLGWKLAFAVHGHAGAGLLDSYDLERRPAAQRVIDHTRAQLALMRPGPELDPLRALFGELLARGGGGEGGVLASMVSGQDTVLPARGADAPPWEGRFLPNTGLVTREGRTDVIGLLAEGRPLLLLFGGPGSSGGYEEEARGWAHLLRVVYAEPVPEFGCEALLVRPDGYVAWASGGVGPAAALAAYFGARRGVGAGSVRAGAAG